MGIETSILIAIASISVSAFTALQAKKKADAAAAKNLGQEIRPSNSSKPIPVLYGRTGTTGNDVWVQTSHNFPQGTDDPDQILPPGGKAEYQDGGKRNAYLMKQSVVGLGSINKVRAFRVNDVLPTNEEMSQNTWVNWKSNGEYNDHAAKFSNERSSTDTFEKLSYSTSVFQITPKDPQFSGVPEVFHMVEGNKVYDPRDGQTKFTANSALVLLDYITHPDYGPSWSIVDDVDVESFKIAADICDQIVQGPGNVFTNPNDPSDSPDYPYTDGGLTYEDYAQLNGFQPGIGNGGYWG